MEEEIKAIKSKLAMLEQHVINLIIPIQNISNVLRSNGSIEELKTLLKLFSQPMKIDDRQLIKSFQEFNANLSDFREEMKNIEDGNKFGELKYIGNRLKNIEESIANIKEEGLKKEVKLNFTCDGYEMVKKTISYDETEQKAEGKKEKLDKILDILDEREKNIVIDRLGIGDVPKKTFKEISKKIKLSASRCSMLFHRSMRRLIIKKGKDILKSDITELINEM
jgi:hypothetical protein